jgi:hypothetical protein
MADLDDHLRLLAHAMSATNRLRQSARARHNTHAVAQFFRRPQNELVAGGGTRADFQ